MSLNCLFPSVCNPDHPPHLFLLIHSSFPPLPAKVIPEQSCPPSIPPPPPALPREISVQAAWLWTLALSISLLRMTVVPYCGLNLEIWERPPKRQQGDWGGLITSFSPRSGTVSWDQIMAIGHQSYRKCELPHFVSGCRPPLFFFVCTKGNLPWTYGAEEGSMMTRLVGIMANWVYQHNPRCNRSNIPLGVSLYMPCTFQAYFLRSVPGERLTWLPKSLVQGSSSGPTSENLKAKIRVSGCSLLALRVSEAAGELETIYVEVNIFPIWPYIMPSLTASGRKVPLFVPLGLTGYSRYFWSYADSDVLPPGFCEGGIWVFPCPSSFCMEEGGRDSFPKSSQTSLARKSEPQLLLIFYPVIPSTGLERDRNWFPSLWESFLSQ